MLDIKEQLTGKRLTTVEILYHLPDYPSLIQSYVWQMLDTPPRYPRLQRFLMFWQQNIDGRVHSVKLSAAKAVRGARYRRVAAESLHTLGGNGQNGGMVGPDATSTMLDRLWRDFVSTSGGGDTVH